MKLINRTFISLAIPTIFSLLSLQSIDATEGFINNQNVSTHRMKRQYVDSCYGAKDCDANPSGFCTSDEDCDEHYRCTSERCVDYCYPDPCGPNAWHVITDHACDCMCFDGYSGDPFIGCSKQCRNDNECHEFEKCENNYCTDVCNAGSCGKGFVRCIPRNHQAKCECAYGYISNPSGKCVANCTVNSDCHSHQKCERGECIARSTCGGKPCGAHASCDVEEHRSDCTCEPGYTGDPSIGCVKIECMNNYHCPNTMKCETNQCIDACDAESCGQNSRCEVTKIHFDVCHCLFGYIGNARTGCVEGCNVDQDCASDERCINNTCINECIAFPAKSIHTRCNVYLHTTRSYECDDGYTAAQKKGRNPDPELECLRSCTQNSDCYDYEQCVENMCTSNVCQHHSCGENAVCEPGPYGATCVCQKGFIGNPSVKCEKGCDENAPCIDYETCQNNKCVLRRKIIQRERAY